MDRNTEGTWTSASDSQDIAEGRTRAVKVQTTFQEEQEHPNLPWEQERSWQGCRVGSREPLWTTVALLVPLTPGPPASQRSHFPARRDLGQLVREGITHLRGVCGSQGRKAFFLPLPQPSLPPGMDFCLAETSWDLAESGRRDAAGSHGFGTEGAGRASLSNRALAEMGKGLRRARAHAGSFPAR